MRNNVASGGVSTVKEVTTVTLYFRFEVRAVALVVEDAAGKRRLLADDLAFADDLLDVLVEGESITLVTGPGKSAWDEQKEQRWRLGASGKLEPIVAP